LSRFRFESWWWIDVLAGPNNGLFLYFSQGTASHTESRIDRHAVPNGPVSHRTPQLVEQDHIRDPCKAERHSRLRHRLLQAHGSSPVWRWCTIASAKLNTTLATASTSAGLRHRTNADGHADFARVCESIAVSTCVRRIRTDGARHRVQSVAIHRQVSRSANIESVRYQDGDGRGGVDLSLSPRSQYFDRDRTRDGTAGICHLMHKHARNGALV